MPSAGARQDIHTRGRLYLVSPTLDPDDVTTALGIEPYDSWRPGQHRTAKRTTKTGGWVLASRLPSGANLEEHATDILDQLTGATEKVATLRDELTECTLALMIGLNVNEVTTPQVLRCAVLKAIQAHRIDLAITFIRDVTPPSEQGAEE